MRTVIVASENPVKITVAKRAFAGVFPKEEFNFIGIKSESGVSEQPIDNETKKARKIVCAILLTITRMQIFG